MGKIRNRKRSNVEAPIVVESTTKSFGRPSWFVSNVAAIVTNFIPIQQDPLPAFKAFKITEDIPVPTQTLPLSCFSSCQSDTVILKFDHPCSFILCGHVCISPLLGKFETFGSEISGPTVIYSSKEFNAFSFTTCIDQNSSVSDLKTRFSSESIIPIDDLENFFANLDTNKHALLMVSSVWVPPLFHAKQYLKFGLEPVTRDSFSLLPQLKKISGCAIDIADSKHYPSFQVPIAWTDLSISSRTVVVGGKSSGKSTLCKYLVNRLLNENDSVLYIECDIGQGEFSPPGCVAAYSLTEPVLGPSFFHQRTPLMLLFLGEVDAVRCHSNYLLAVQYLINEIALPKYSSVPWIVNTMGFCQGLGVHLNYRVIQTVQPTTVIQLQVNDNKRNFKLPLTPKRVSDQVALIYDFFLIDSVCADIENKKMRTGRADRELKLLSHLSPVLTAPHYSFNEAQPYVIPFSKLYIGVSSNIAACDILRVMNGALVALYEGPIPGDRVLSAPNDQGEWFKIVVKPAVQPCVELGLVRGIDVAKKEVYVVTGVPLARLEKVRMLVLGSVDLPPAVMTAQTGAKEKAPYTDTGTDSRALETVRRVHREPINSNPID